MASELGVGTAEILDDARQECLARLMTHSDTLARARRSASLRAFAWGCMRNVSRQLRREASSLPRSASEGIEFIEAPDRQSEASPTDYTTCLTVKEKEALRMLREGGESIAAVARRLRVSWSATRERLARAYRRIVDRASSSTGNAPDPRDRSWAWDFLRSQTSHLDPVNVAILEHFARGASYREIGERFGLTREAVRSRIRRMKRQHLRPDHPP